MAIVDEMATAISNQQYAFAELNNSRDDASKYEVARHKMGQSYRALGELLIRYEAGER